MKEAWQDVYDTQGYRAVYPSEYVVRFIAATFGKSNIPFPQHDFSRFKILDLGCGTGRHVVYLAREGFHAYGIEQSETGIALASRWLAEEGLSAELAVGDITALPYPDALFDAIIDFQSIQHNTMARIRAAFAEAYRVLKPGGCLFAVLRASSDYLAGRGLEVERNTRADIPDGDMRGAGTCHFFEKAELVALTTGFVEVSMTMNRRSTDGEGDEICEWLVTARKR